MTCIISNSSIIFWILRRSKNISRIKNKMRKVILSNMVRLDGFFEEPNKELDWHIVDEEFNGLPKLIIGEIGMWKQTLDENGCTSPFRCTKSSTTKIIECLFLRVLRGYPQGPVHGADEKL
jgi:hypothetical protein